MTMSYIQSGVMKVGISLFPFEVNKLTELAFLATSLLPKVAHGHIRLINPKICKIIDRLVSIYCI
jgi:hypothetical protein